MPNMEVRCADEECAHHATGFPEDGTGCGVDAMSAHHKESGHGTEGLYVDGAMVVKGNKFSKIWLQNHGFKKGGEGGAAASGAPDGDPAAPWPDDDGADDDDGEEDEDEEGEGDGEGDAGRPAAARSGRRPGRPPMPDLMRGYLVARDIPIDHTCGLWIQARIQGHGDLMVDDDGNELPYPLKVAQIIAEAIAYDQAMRPDRYPMVRNMQQAHFAIIQNHYRHIAAQAAELDAQRMSLEQRFRDLADREEAVARKGGAAVGG